MPNTLAEFNPQAHNALERLYKDLEQQVCASLERYPEIQCTTGCFHCCHSSGSPLIAPLEWQRIRRAWKALSAERQDKIRAQYQSLKEELRRRLKEGDRDLQQALYHSHCMFLLDGRCSIYADRPLTCRAFGVSQQEHTGAPPWEGVYACAPEKERWETVLRQHDAPPEPELPEREAYFERLKELDASPLLTLLSYFDWDMRHAVTD